MTKREKRIERMRQNPRAVRFEELDTLLLSLGFAKRQASSHIGYYYGTHFVTVVYRTPFVLPVYVKKALAVIDAVLEETEDE
jgi:hypothetical protein